MDCKKERIIQLKPETSHEAKIAALWGRDEILWDEKNYGKISNSRTRGRPLKRWIDGAYNQRL